MNLTPAQYLKQVSEQWVLNQSTFLKECSDTLLESSRVLAECLKNGGKALVFGNGGSAADAQHVAAEMTGRMILERRGLPAIALTTDTSALTAIGNDYGFTEIYARQIQALARKGDYVIALSTSGNSENVLRGVEVARAMGCRTLGLTGGDGGKLKNAVEFSLNVSQAKNSSRIQEIHIFALHNLVDLMDRFFLPAG